MFTLFDSEISLMNPRMYFESVSTHLITSFTPLSAPPLYKNVDQDLMETPTVISVFIHVTSQCLKDKFKTLLGFSNDHWEIRRDPPQL